MKKILTLFVIGILVCTLLAVAVSPVIGLVKNNKIKTNNSAHNEDNLISFYQTNNYNGVLNEKSNGENKIITFENYRNGEVVDQQQTSYCYNGWGVLDTQWIAQSFTPSLEVLTRVQLYMFKQGIVNGIQITVSIRESLNGNDLINVSVDAIILEYLPKWIDFDFADISVIPGHTYYIVARAPEADDYNPIAWGYDINNPYEGGDAWCAFSPEFDWFLLDAPDFPECDCCFMTYGLDNAPNTPTITGPNSGKPNTEYEFTFVSTDPEGDAVMYNVDWGDGDTDWTEYGDSGAEISLKHTWTSQGTYTIKAQAVDFYGAESEWATFTVTIPRDKVINRPLLQFLQNHPNLFPLLQKLIFQLRFGL